MVHLLGSLDIGGAELLLLNLSRELGQDAAEQTFLLLAGRRGAIAGRFEDLGARVEQCPLRPALTFPTRLFRALRSLRPDLVVSHVSLVSGLVLTVARAARVPKRIAWIHSDGDGRRSTAPRRALRAVLRRLLLANATAVVAVNPVALRFAVPEPARWPHPTAVLPNGVDTVRFAPRDQVGCRQRLGLPAGSFVAVHLGRAAPEKNRPFLVPVWRALREMGLDATLVYAGPGGTADVAGQYPCALQSPSIVFAGAVDDVPSLLAAADVVFLPSTREGMPGVVLEALSCGVPVVANDLPGPRELAEVLPGLSIVDIRLGAAEWAAAAVRAALGGVAGRGRLHDAVAASHYALGPASRAWRALW
jgi:glycosyltransferase involved in cell wall biosynthesis